LTNGSEAYHLVRCLIVGVYRASEGWDDSDEPDLRGSLRHSAVAAGLHIVEASWRRLEAERRCFFEKSLAELARLGLCIEASERKGLIAGECAAILASLQARATDALSSSINGLARQST
jgi:hypothetical protein